MQYFEKDAGDKNSAGKNYKYATARYERLIAGNKTTHSIVFENYDYKKEVRNKVFMKKYSFRNDPDKSLTIIGKLPRISTKDEKNFTDASRDGYRSSQTPDVQFINYYNGENIFSGTEAVNELDRFLFADNRKVGLTISGLQELIE